jgi:bifunctional NMN adenylyltransferase/nudix hydrolase
MNKRELGVIIARFQTDELTPAHQYLLEQVATRVNRVLVLIGCAPVIGLKKNPLEYRLREQMVYDWWHQKFGATKEIAIQALPDMPTDAVWSANVDRLIDIINLGGAATIFCGPDGAGPAYKEAGGRHPIEVLDSMGGHASKVRENLNATYTRDFRAGVIYAVERRFLNPYPVVDVIIRDGDNVLLGQKSLVDAGKWRLIGGFVDISDASLEAAVRREVLEETKLEVSEPMYVGSARVDDWRFRSGPEGILTSVFYCQRLFGSPTPNDDIDELRWFHKDEVDAVIIPNHAHLYELTKKVQ